MGIVEQYLLQLNTEKRRWRQAVSILTVLSLIVALVTVWNLRMTGVTIANSASCGYEEHQHIEDCLQDGMPICGKEEHLHNTTCYSNPKADTETSLDWQKMFEDYPYTGVLREDLVGIAKTQVGYTESQLNFEVSDIGQRKGYTRYGAWYGAPYNDWSAMFVSFCLNYAGANAAEFPNSSGAAMMAELWKTHEKYIAVGDYIPQSGDIVFFNNNTAGIVTEVYNATFYVIRGDLQNAVAGNTMSLSDASIVGWGSTETPTSQEKLPTEDVPETSTEATEPSTEATEPSPEDLLDISNGPAFFIIEGNDSQMQRQRFSLRSTRMTTDLIPYLDANGGNYFYTLLDLNNVELPKDENGNYIAQAQKDYKLTITFNSPKGFLPGTYQYQIPNGLMVNGGEGEFVLKDGTNVGCWAVTETGLITLVFNEHMNSRTDITISSTLGIHFPEQDEPIDFDGKITIRVEPPVQKEDPTYLEKWTDPGENTDKLVWHVNILGRADSQIPGSILTDQILLPEWYKPHSYTQSDMDAGISFGVSDPNGGWHSWTVRTDDPRLIWDESTWSYKIPQTVICDICGELELGNNGWAYYITYTSTPTPLNTPGTFSYANKVTVDGQTAWGWNEFTHGQVNAEIVKNGAFVSDAQSGGFLWEIQTTIPGRPEGQRAEYAWAISDEMRLWNQYDGTVAMLPNDINLATVTATYNGTTIQIPRIQDATEQDMFAWDNSWTSGGVPSTRTINILCRCQCTPETCHWGGCGEYWYVNNYGVTVGTRDFCQCWTEAQNMTFTLVYKTTDISLVEQYGALGYKVYNQAQLFYLDDTGTTVPVDKDDAVVTIPNLFSKELTQDYNGHTAHYKITVNEAKIALTNGSPLTIRDVMTDTLAYISGSLVITAEDASGTAIALQQGQHYTVSYDGSGNQTDQNGNKVHVLDIVILHPQPVMYTLNYDTTLIMPEHITGGIKYSNSATVTLWGEDISDNAVEKVYADINIAAKSYAVDMFKTCAVTNKPLPGATFCLYNAQGGLIATGTTDANGKLSFQTNIVAGIILQEHTPYYMQELRSPTAYQLDKTKHWFCFCDSTSDACTACNKILLDVDAIRIPFGQVGIVDIVNYPTNFELPATGSIGTPIYILCGLILVLGPFVYGFRLRRRHRREAKE